MSYKTLNCGCQISIVDSQYFEIGYFPPMGNQILRHRAVASVYFSTMALSANVGHELFFQCQQFRQNANLMIDNTIFDFTRQLSALLELYCCNGLNSVGLALCQFFEVINIIIRSEVSSAVVTLSKIPHRYILKTPCVGFTFRSDFECDYPR
jgi:hypothetical protein